MKNPQHITSQNIGAIFRHWLSIIALILPLINCSGNSPEQTWEQGIQGLYSADLTNSGQSIIASIQHGGSLWQLTNGERLYNWNLSSGGYTDLIAVAISPDGTHGVTADSRRLVLWSTKTGQSAGFWNAPADILSVALSNEGKYILIGMKNYTAIFIDVAQGGILSTVNHSGNVRSVSISADGKLGLTGSDDKTAKLWRLEDGTELMSWDHDNLVNFVSLSRSGQLAITSGQHSAAQVWSTQTKDIIMHVGNRGASISAARFSPDDKHLLVGNTAREITLWNLATKLQKEKWIAPKKSYWKPAGARVYAVAFGPTPNTILATSSNGLSAQFHSQYLSSPNTIR